MYKAIFIDIDGTLRDSNKRISKRTIKAIKKITKKGVLVVLCSGRPKKYTEYLSKKCHASKYIITSVGGAIYNYVEDTTLYLNIMDKTACLELYKISQREHTDFLLHVGQEDNIISVSDIKINIENFINQNDILQCVIIDEDFEKIKNLESEIKSIQNVQIKNRHRSLLYEDEPQNGNIYYGIANIESSKGNAIKELCKILNIDLKDTIAIGNDYNDISMFNIAGYSVVMDNAKESIKKYASEVTESNDNDGVAIFLEKLIKQLKI